MLRSLPRPLWILFAGTTVVRLGAFVVPYLAIYLSQTLGFSLVTTGQAIAGGGAGMLLGNLAGGWLADRWGRVPTLLTALVINAVATGSMATELGSPGAYALALAVASAGAGLYMPAANALVADLSDDAVRPFAYTVHYVCINIGMGLGPLLGGLLALGSMHWLFAGDVVSTLSCAALVAVGLRPAVRRSVAARATEPSDGRGLVAVWRDHRRVAIFCAASALLMAPLMGLEYAVPLLVEHELSAPLPVVGAVYSVNAACILLLSFRIERLVRGRDPAAMMRVAGALWTAGVGVLWLGHSVVALLGCTVVWTLGEIIASIVLPTYVSRRVAPSAKGRMLALLDVMRSGCGIVCPIAVGMVWQAADVHAAIGLLMVLPALGVVAYTVLDPLRAAGAR